MGSNDIRSKPEENAGDKEHEKAEYGKEMFENALRVSY